MKKIILLANAIFLTIGLYAQTTLTNYNPSLEAWNDVGNDKEEPQYFNSIKNGSGNMTAINFAPKSCYREATNPHTGTYCARLVTGSALGQVAPGSMTTGRVMVPNLTAAQGYIMTIPGDADYSMPFLGRPDSLVFWFRYTRAGNDFPSITALLHVGRAYLPEAPVSGNHPDSSVNIISRAIWNGPTSSVAAWTRIAIPFVYVDGRTPQYILMTMTPTGNSSPSTAGSTLYLDDLEVIYNPTVTTGTVSTGPFYVSSTTGAAVTVPFTLTGTFTPGNTVTAQLSDASGSFAAPVNIGSVTATASGNISATLPANTASGAGYRIRVVSSNPALTAANNGSNITINLVSNSVAPSASQTIPVSTNGTALAVTESAGFASREWKFSTTQGGPYSSFGPVQNGISYTPNFATAGTYYIVCTTTYPGGLVVTSNEIVINAVSNSVSPSSTQTIPVTVNGTLLTVAESLTPASREWKYSTVSGGPYNSFIPTQSNTTYTPNFVTAGVYYIVCISSYIGGLNLTSSQVQVNVAENSIAPFAVQNIATNANGTVLTVSETPTVSSREWKYATVSGGPYTAFAPAQNGSTYTPNFSTPGTYYIVAVSTFGSLVLISNQVQVNVVGNSIAPNVAQSLLVGVDGNQLTVTETPVGTTREWLVSSTQGGPYSAFAPAETGNTYTPNFNTAGSYYVVCRSVISGVNVTSNEVLISVGNATITTGTVTGSPYEFSASAPNFSLNVPFTTSGAFNSGNTFTAQLSDANGSFALPVNIGSLAGTASGTVSAQIPASTPAGSAYRIRVVGDDPLVLGSDNGVDLVVDQFNNSVVPSATQTVALSTNGNTLTVTESQNASREWKFSTTSGSGYVSFAPVQTSVTYVPNFSTPGTYYVVAVSKNQFNDEVTSNEVQINVQNGNTLTTVSATGSPFQLSPNATATSTVTFSSNAVFNPSNMFTAELSDASGSFTNPVVIGTINGSSISPIVANIPNNTPAGAAYRIRVVSSDPALTGTDNGVDLVVDQFNNAINPAAAQTIQYNTNGTTLTVTESQTATREWKFSTTSGGSYNSFTTPQTASTYVPNFANPGTYYVVAVSKNQYNDEVTSNEVEITVTNGTTLTTVSASGSPYLVSSSATVTTNVVFTTNVIFNPGNIFTAQLSNASGSFVVPVSIGTLNGTSAGTITATIPNNSVSGTGYRIRVVSSDPVATGTDNGTNLTIVPFEIGVTPSDTQFVAVNTNGATISAQSTHPATYKWKYSDLPGANYTPFSPAQTNASYTPRFNTLGTYYVACEITNQWTDVATTQDVVVVVGLSGINETGVGVVRAWFAGNNINFDLTGSDLENPTVVIYNLEGRAVETSPLNSKSLNTIATDFANGLYLFRITDGTKSFAAKIAKQ